MPRPSLPHMTTNNTDIKRLAKHLPIDSADVSLLILKGHLLLEELLNEYLESKLPRPEHLEEARLTFFQRVAITRALEPLGPNDWVWSALAKLNTARNAFAHNLEPPNAEAKRNEFIASVPLDDVSQPSGVPSPFRPLALAVITLYFALADTLRFKPTHLLLAEALRNWQPSNQEAEDV